MLIDKLGPTHAVDTFDCGDGLLDRFLRVFALGSQRAGSSATYVAHEAEAVLAYYTIVVGEVAFDEAAERMRKGLARYPVPVMVLARLAVDQRWQGRGLGASMLREAMLRTLQAADIAGIRAFVVHAKDDKAAAFYRKFDFVTSPTDPLHLFMLLKDVRAIFVE